MLWSQVIRSIRNTPEYPLRKGTVCCCTPKAWKKQSFFPAGIIRNFLNDAIGGAYKPMLRVHTAGSVGGSTGIVAANMVQTRHGMKKRIELPSPLYGTPTKNPNVEGSQIRPRRIPQASAPVRQGRTARPRIEPDASSVTAEHALACHRQNNHPLTETKKAWPLLGQA